MVEQEPAGVCGNYVWWYRGMKTSILGQLWFFQFWQVGNCNDHTKIRNTEAGPTLLRKDSTSFGSPWGC